MLGYLPKIHLVPSIYLYCVYYLSSFDMNINNILCIMVLLIPSSFGISMVNIISKVVSPFFEQCDSRWVTRNINGLEEDLNANVFGQELAVGVILTALQSHLSKPFHKKPLVLSFHGWTGGGKTYVKDFILKHWFSNGDRSKFVKMYFAEKDFPSSNENDVYKYKMRLHKELEETIYSCPRAVFVFDEVDKYPAHVLDAIKPFLDYNTHINGYDYRQAIFILITNTGGELITEIALKSWQQGMLREEMRLRDFEEALRTLSFNDEGGFYRSDLIRHHLIDYIVPFLPLERSHVQSCIQAVFEHAKKDGTRLKDRISDQFFQLAIRDILEEITFVPKKHPLYASQGCHNLEPKVYVKVEELKKREQRNRSRSEENKNEL